MILSKWTQPFDRARDEISIKPLLRTVVFNRFGLVKVSFSRWPQPQTSLTFFRYLIEAEKFTFTPRSASESTSYQPHRQMWSLEDVNKGCASLTLSASFFSSSSLFSHFGHVKPQVSLRRAHVTCPSLWRQPGSEDVYLFESPPDTPEAAPITQ